MDTRSPLPRAFRCPEWDETNGECCPLGAVRDDCPEIEGYWLEQERLAANRGCAVSPNHFIQGVAVAFILIATGWALYAANAAIGVPV